RTHPARAGPARGRPARPENLRRVVGAARHDRARGEGAPMTDAILAEGLVKRYKEVTALGGIDLRVPEGSVLALLGPNGAGKTNAVKILTTLITADEGRAEVAGIDVASDPRAVRRKIGVSGQYAAVDEYL